MKEYGCQSMVAPIRRMLVKRPEEAFVNQESINAQWMDLNYTAPPQIDLAQKQHTDFVRILEGFHVEIHTLPVDDRVGLDSLYVHDPVIVSNHGAILCNMRKQQRSGETAAAKEFFESIGIPIHGSIEGDGRLEGGDVVWLNERTVAVGEGYRSNTEGIRQLREILGDLVDEVIAVPLPHWDGRGDVLHLMSLLSPLDENLSLVYSRLMVVPFRQRLLAMGIELVEVPDEEYESMGCNVLAVSPRKAIMLAGNPITRERMEAKGVQVVEIDGSEMSHKGAGGPTCLTRPFLRV